MITYKRPSLQGEFLRAHPLVQQMVQDLDGYCDAYKFPNPVITHVERFIEDQGDIYWTTELKNTGGRITPQEARTRAEKRASLHLHLAAVDLRDYIYTRPQIDVLMGVLREQAKGYPHPFEILDHNVGSGFHFHVGIRDPSWINLHPARRRK